ncbi:MAG: universal stress protein [Desulfomonilaceae bacterium]
MLPKRILMCTDFSENSLPARQYAIEWAKAFGAELFILHVVNSRLLGYPGFAASALGETTIMIEEQIRKGVEEELETIAEECQGQLEKVRVFSETGSPAEEIVAFAKAKGVDLIVMGTHGWTGAKHLLLGSTAENVVRTSECPVLTVRVPPKKT